MKYLQGTRDLTLTIEPSKDPKWWVDSSYEVLLDMRSHGGIYMTLGKGTTYSTSSKQKLNMKCSMEAELVAIDESMAQVLWTRHFLMAQGECRLTTTIYQDNKSTILLAEMGRRPAVRELGICTSDIFCHRQNQEERDKDRTTLTTPKHSKSQKGIFFYLQLNEPIAFERTPSKCIDFLKEQL